MLKAKLNVGGGGRKVITPAFNFEEAVITTCSLWTSARTCSSGQLCLFREVMDREREREAVNSFLFH